VPVGYYSVARNGTPLRAKASLSLFVLHSFWARS
jgi:hypothetical protein